MKTVANSMSGRRPSRPSPVKRVRGIALIEALIGILIFAFGVLGLVGLQAAMTRAQASGKLRTDAANLANDLMGLIETDTKANLENYNSAACTSYARCKDWQAKVEAALPGAVTAVNVNKDSGLINVTVSWQQGGDSRNQYQTSMMWKP